MYSYERLKGVRKSAGLSQAEVAKILGTAREQYSKYESGKQELPMHHFLSLAKYYNLSLDYLSGLSDTPRRLFTDLSRNDV